MTQTDTRTVIAHAADRISIVGLTAGPRSCWELHGDTLTSPTGARINLTPDAVARIEGAVAAIRHPRRLTGSQIQQLPADDRDGWKFSHIRNEVHGMYVKGAYEPGTCELARADVVSIDNATRTTS